MSQVQDVPANVPVVSNPNPGNAPLKTEGLTLRDLLEKRRDIIAAVLPKHLTPERLIKLASVAAGRDPKLSRATAMSLVNAVVKAAELGLDCSGTLGSAYLVPFEVSKKDDRGNWYKQIEATLIVGYRGLIDLARRSGQIASIEARVVWEHDEFEFEYGLEPRLKHKPVLDKERGPLRLVYAIGKLKDGAVQVEVMTKGEIDSIKARSKSASSDKSPWNTDYSEMARKTVVKRLCKYLPLSVEVQEIIAVDNESDPIDLIEGQAIGKSRLAERLAPKIPTDRPVSEGQTLEPDPDLESSINAQDAIHGEVVDATEASEQTTDKAKESPAPKIQEPKAILSHEELVELCNSTAQELGIAPSVVDAGMAEAIKGQNVKRMTPAARAEIFKHLLDRTGPFAAK